MRDKVEEIVDQIVTYSDGTFDIQWTEEFEKLSEEDQEKAEALVHEALGNCDMCGWTWARDNLEYHESTAQEYCWKCYSTVEEDEDEG